MLACRLCLAFGQQDPEQWLEQTPKRVVNLWRAFAIADGWFTERRLAAVAAVSMKRLLALKYQPEARGEVLKGIEEVANKYLPVDQQWSDEPQPMDPDALKMMARGGEVLNTPTYSAEVEGVDPWRRQ